MINIIRERTGYNSYWCYFPNTEVRSFLEEDRQIHSKSGDIIVGENVLTKFERARIVGARALQLSQGAPSLIDLDNTFDFQPIDVAKMELSARVLPLGIARKFPGGRYQIIQIQRLKDREFISQVEDITDI